MYLWKKHTYIHKLIMTMPSIIHTYSTFLCILKEPSNSGVFRLANKDEDTCQPQMLFLIALGLLKLSKIN